MILPTSFLLSVSVSLSLSHYPLAESGWQTRRGGGGGGGGGEKGKGGGGGEKKGGDPSKMFPAWGRRIQSERERKKGGRREKERWEGGGVGKG